MLQDFIRVLIRCQKSDILWINAKDHDHLFLNYSCIRNSCW
jgi:hypothetical protein